MRIAVSVIFLVLLGVFIGFLCAMIALLKMRMFDLEDALNDKNLRIESITEALKTIDGANKITEESLKLAADINETFKETNDVQIKLLECIKEKEELENDVR